MVLDEMNAIHNPWINLQQPSHTSIGITASLRLILGAIDQGWELEEPVEAMTTTREDVWIYCFVLSDPESSQSCRLYTAATFEMEQFIERNQFQVIENSFF